MSNTEIAKRLKLTNPGNIDAWYGPYNSIAAACAAVPSVSIDGVNMRTGKVVGINTPDGIVDHWWNLGVLDSDLLPVFLNLTPLSYHKTLKSLLYAIDGADSVSFNKATKVLTFGNLYIFNGKSYLKINAGTFDIATPIAVRPTENYWYIYLKVTLPFLNGTETNPLLYNPAAIEIKSYTEPTLDIRNSVSIPLFYFNRITNNVSSPFLVDYILDIKKRLNGFKALNYMMGTSNVTFDNTTRIINSTGNMYVFSGTYNTAQSYIRLNAGSLDLTPAITAFPTAEYFYIYAKPAIGFLDGSGSSVVSINISDLLVKPYLDPTVGDVRSDNAIILFRFNKLTGAIASPFFDEKILDLINKPTIDPSVKTQLKLHYTHRGTFSWNDTTKVLTWNGFLYIFNRAKIGTGAANYIRLDSGSFDFKTYADTSVDEFFVAYLKLTTAPQLAFVNGSGTSGNVLNPSVIIYKSWNDAGISEVRETNTIVLFYYNKTTGKVSSPFLEEDIHTKFLLPAPSSSTAIVPWVNLYPNVYSKLPNFVKRLGYGIGGNGETKTRIVMLGDSLFARYQHTSILNVTPNSNPPTFITKNIGAYIWESLKGNKPRYSRYDKSGIFTEVGTWATAEDLANWDDAGDISTLTRRSTDTTASFQFTTNSASSKYFNLIDRLDTTGIADATVQVTEGNGVLQARLDGSAIWVEANGFVFSQRAATANSGLGIGNTVYQRRIEFKKIGAGIGASITVKVVKGTANGDALMYWGIEEILGDKPYNQLIDVARGGHTFAALKPYVQSDVFDRKPDLIVLEIPLLNMIAADSSMAYTINQLHDFVWGDRSGAINPNSLKVKSNNWADFEVLLVIPQHSRVHFNSDNSFATQSSGYTAEELYNAVKGFIYSRGDVPFIDISTALMAEITADPLFNGDYYTALNSSGVTGTGYFNDSIHQNDKGTLLWAKNLAPIFSLNTY